MTQRQCNGINKMGEQCNGKALPDSEFCIAHDPAKIVAITEARRKGGQARSNKSKARKAMVDGALSPAELEGLLGITLHAVFHGKKEPGVANAIANLARAAVAVRDAVAVDERLAELERRLGSRSA